jgi:NitT/TauT family transport system permease protein
VKALFNRHIIVLQIAFFVLLVGLWQLASVSGRLNPFTVSSPTVIATQLVSWVSDGSLLWNILATLQIVSIGYVAGLVIGVAIGVTNSLSPTLRAYFDPFLVFGNSLPRIVLIPFFITWLGFGLAPKVIVVFLVLVFLVAINIENGMRQIGSDIVNHARILGAGFGNLLWDVYLPGVGLWVLISARICVGYGLQAAIVSEFFGSHSGLGFLVLKGEAAYDVGTIYAALVVTVILALVIDYLLGLLEYRTMRWLPAAE